MVPPSWKFEPVLPRLRLSGSAQVRWTKELRTPQPSPRVPKPLKSRGAN